MTFVIGVDGGGSVTRAVIVDEHGAEVARAEAPGAVVTDEAPGAAADAVSRAVGAAAAISGRALPASVLWAGLAGAGREAARRAVEQELGRRGLAERVCVGTDVEAAFHAAFPEGPGILLIAGTGSIAWARDAAGDVVRVGGWGQLLGDEGSGYAIGLGALRAVVRAEDGRAGATAMRAGVLRELELESPAALTPWAATASKADVARLVPVVTRAADGGDPAAADLIARAVAGLEAHVVAVLRRVGPAPEDPELVLWGGLIGERGPLRTRLCDRLVSHPVVLRSGDPDPALGAAALALAALPKRQSRPGPLGHLGSDPAP